MSNIFATESAAAHGVSAPTAAKIRKAAGIAPLPNKGGAWRTMRGDKES